MYELVKLIHMHCENYLNYIDEIGNECAYTDRIVEAIYKEAEVLHKNLDDYFASIDVEALDKEISKMIDEQLSKEYDEETKSKFFKRIE